MPGGFHSLPPGTGEYRDLHSEKQSSRFMGLLHPCNTQWEFFRSQADSLSFREIRFAVTQEIKRSHGIPYTLLSLPKYVFLAYYTHCSAVCKGKSPFAWPSVILIEYQVIQIHANVLILTHFPTPSYAIQNSIFQPAQKLCRISLTAAKKLVTITRVLSSGQSPAPVPHQDRGSAS